MRAPTTAPVALAAAAVTAAGLLVAPASAGSAAAAEPVAVRLAVADGGFESVAVPDGSAVPGTPRGWSGWTRLTDPGPAQYAGTAGGGTTGTMAGPQVLTVHRGGTGGAAHTTRTLVRPGLTYRLTVAVGHRTTGTWGGARVSLRAGATEVAATEVTEPPAAGSFGDVTVTWTADDAHAGLRLGIGLDTAAGATLGSYADFDAVRLRASGTSRRPGTLVVASPTAGQVLQRGRDGRADVVVRVANPPGSTVSARLVPRPTGGRLLRGRVTPWVSTRDPGYPRLVVPRVRTGWYDLQVRSTAPSRTVTVRGVGVGEVFLVAGQSNSANAGQVRQRVAAPGAGAPAFAYGGWQRADDPQPNAGAVGGSPWPAFADRFTRTTGVPVGVVSVGYGATNITQWQPGGGLYPRILTAVDELGAHGFRAVLWHQGETDAHRCLDAKTYAARMRALVRATRRAADRGGLPWVTATASRSSATRPSCERAVRAGQARVRKDLDGVLAGPDTDGYAARGWTFDGTHFSATGLTNHGRAWVSAVVRAGLVPRRR